jgi:hypothetical protein
MTMDELERELLQAVERIDAVMNQKALTWYGVRKALNDLKTQNRRFYPNLTSHLFSDIREMYIEELPLWRLYPELDKAMALSIQLEKQLNPIPVLDEPAFKLPKMRELEIAC